MACGCLATGNPSPEQSCTASGWQTASHNDTRQPADVPHARRGEPSVENLSAEDKQKPCAPLITKGGTYTHAHALEKSGGCVYTGDLHRKKELTETQESNARYFAFFYNRAIIPSTILQPFALGHRHHDGEAQ